MFCSGRREGRLHETPAKALEQRVRALRAVKEVVAKSGRHPDEFAVRTLRIGGATTLAAGGDISERVIQREEKWRSDAYKANTRNNIEDARRVSCKLGVASGERRGSRGKEQYGVRDDN